MTGKRKRYAAEFNAKVALQALRGELTTAQLATKHGCAATSDRSIRQDSDEKAATGRMTTGLGSCT
jgi:transposase-like protein